MAPAFDGGGETEYRCEVCGKNCKSPQSLAGHVKAAHGILPRPRPRSRSRGKVNSGGSGGSGSGGVDPSTPSTPPPQLSDILDVLKAGATTAATGGGVPTPMSMPTPINKPLPNVPPPPPQSTGGGDMGWLAALAPILAQLIQTANKPKSDPFAEMAYKFFAQIVENSANQVLDTMQYVQKMRAKGIGEAEKEDAKAERKRMLQLRKVIKETLDKELQRKGVKNESTPSESEEGFEEEPPH